MAQAKTKTTDQTTADVTEPVAPAPESGATDLSVQDLSTMKGIIDVASSRGTFKANEMESVGRLYNKLELFLNEVAKQQGES